MVWWPPNIKLVHCYFITVILLLQWTETCPAAPVGVTTHSLRTAGLSVSPSAILLAAVLWEALSRVESVSVGSWAPVQAAAGVSEGSVCCWPQAPCNHVCVLLSLGCALPLPPHAPCPAFCPSWCQYLWEMHFHQDSHFWTMAMKTALSLDFISFNELPVCQMQLYQALKKVTSSCVIVTSMVLWSFKQLRQRKYSTNFSCLPKSA